MEMFVWWEALISMRVEWRCASMTSGGQCVMMAGTMSMPLWSVNNLDTPLKVRHCFRFCNFLVHDITQTLCVELHTLLKHCM